MKLNNFLVFYKESTAQEHRKTITAVKKIIRQHKIKATFLERSKFDKESLKDYDLIVSVGGDGTFLRASHFAYSRPVLGINSNTETSEGVLCSATKHNLEEKLVRIAAGKFTVKKFTRVRVSFLNTGSNYDALNEIYIGSATPYHTSRYILKLNKIKERQKSSGVIVATGAGSTAWYGSIAKENFNPKAKELRFAVREPYEGKLLKPTLVKGKLNMKQKLYLKLKMSRGVVALDSIIEVPLPGEEEIEVSISPKPAQVVSF